MCLNGNGKRPKPFPNTDEYVELNRPHMRLSPPIIHGRRWFGRDDGSSLTTWLTTSPTQCAVTHCPTVLTRAFHECHNPNLEYSHHRVRLTECPMHWFQIMWSAWMKHSLVVLRNINRHNPRWIEPSQHIFVDHSQTAIVVLLF